ASNKTSESNCHLTDGLFFIFAPPMRYVVHDFVFLPAMLNADTGNIVEYPIVEGGYRLLLDPKNQGSPHTLSSASALTEWFQARRTRGCK
ncbi:MAG: hypothetical protein J2P31_04960, partial [Blastocatellia bacterium]|nr:hypothetical protein [Blastocatellia bacterium]